MEKIVYVTGNYGKYLSIKKYFEKSSIGIDFYTYDFNEPEINNVIEISKSKAYEIYQILKKPCLVDDSGFYIEDYPHNPGYPGALVKRSGIANDIDSLLINMKNVQNRSCYFKNCLTFYDGDNINQFIGTYHGELAKTKSINKIVEAKSNLWYLFIPTGSNVTLGDMTREEREANYKKYHIDEKELFINWYKNEYLLVKKKELK